MCRTKVGHGGTLDPLAEGILPIALGEATKLAGRMLDSDKVYAFTIAFGEETETLDAEGAVVARSDRRPPLAAVAAICAHFTGAIEQVPPKYSALKVDGRRAYDLARAGEAVELETRRVTVHSLTLAARPGLAAGAPCAAGAAPDEQDSRPTSSERAGECAGFELCHHARPARSVRPAGAARACR